MELFYKKTIIISWAVGSTWIHSGKIEGLILNCFEDETRLWRKSKESNSLSLKSVVFINSMGRFNSQNEKYPFFPMWTVHQNNAKKNGIIPYLLTSGILDSLGFVHSNDIKVSVTSWPPWSQAEVALEVICVPEMCGPYHAGLRMLFMLQMLALKSVLFILTV